MNLYKLSAGDRSPNVVNVIIEVPAGSSNKYEYDKDTNLIKLDRVLYPAMHYPGDYGFIPSTLGGDGDPLDVIILSTYPFLPKVLVEARPVGILEMTDDKGDDSKILAVPDLDPRFTEIQDLSDVSSHKLAEIEHFFARYKELEKKQVISRGWKSKEFAFSEIKQGIERIKTVSF